MPGVDAAGAKALFDELAPNDIASRVFEADGNYTIVQLVEKSQAKIEDFDKEADQILADMRAVRGRALVTDWLKARCKELDEAGKIKPMAELIAETDDKGKPLPTVYKPCMTLR
jgi:hypothetical protein